MQAATVPAALREKLGEPGTAGLLDLLETSGKEWKTDVLTVASERFEHRVAVEGNKLRLEMTTGFADVRQDMAQMKADLRQDMAKMESGLRQDMGRMESGLRQDMGRMESTLRQEIRDGLATVRVELIKWSFAFWVGQMLTVIAVIALMLRK